MRGQSLIEFVVCIVVLGPLLLGLFQAILLYRAKTVLDYAALQAARKGATNFAQISAMCDGLAGGLTPLYTHQASGSAVLTSFYTAKADVCTGNAATITIVSPTQVAFRDWKETQYDGVSAIPNDSLPFRGSKVGANSGMTVQDANILKIAVTYKYPLIVPVIDRMIGTFDVVRSAAEGHTVYSLSLASQAIVRMQTPIRDPSQLPGG
ncbi:pilus assembly protein [Dyella mobilis]|uniref:Pilus assembly protein n=2 Tax=Dyella mobilis TaxID=1849582 RepID=A0ABS2KK64_9GAMM|nr:pilus assembly protein [Dyella mobilis]